MKLKSATTIAAIKAAYTQLRVTTTSTAGAVAGVVTTNQLKFDVSALNRLVASVQEGNFVLFASLFDTFYVNDGAGVSDGAVLELFKALTDNAAAADVAILALTKSLADGVNLQDADEIVKGFTRGLHNTASVTDPIFKGFSTGFAHGVAAAQDAASLHPNKGLFEAPAALDEINTFGVGLGKFDTPITSDAHETTFGKPLQDASIFGDDNTVSSEKLLADSVFATDDVDGEASILDDQEMQFVKQHTDIVGMSDFIQLGIVFTRDFVSNSALVDSISSSIAKPFSSSYAASDILNVVTGKHVRDDVLALSDALTRTVSTVRADAASISDAQAAALSKVLSDTPSIADAGALRSHNYCDFAYFAEDYVGASRTFT